MVRLPLRHGADLSRRATVRTSARRTRLAEVKAFQKRERQAQGRARRNQFANRHSHPCAYSFTVEQFVAREPASRPWRCEI